LLPACPLVSIRSVEETPLWSRGYRYHFILNRSRNSVDDAPTAVANNNNNNNNNNNKAVESASSSSSEHQQQEPEEPEATTTSSSSLAEQQEQDRIEAIEEKTGKQQSSSY
jgi:hypothetical protein